VSHTPTRDHPHRWCRPLHRARMVAVVVVITAFLSTGRPVSEIGFVLLVFVLCIAVHRLTTGGRSMREVVERDRVERRAGTVLTARPVWSRASVAADVLVLAYLVWGAFRMVSEGLATGASPHGGRGFFSVTTVLAILLPFLMISVPHDRGVEPAETPADAQTGSDACLGS
jgi:hypothetical protein